MTMNIGRNHKFVFEVGSVNFLMLYVNFPFFLITGVLVQMLLVNNLVPELYA